MPPGAAPPRRAGFAVALSALVLLFLGLEVARVLPGRTPEVADFGYYYASATAIADGRSPYVAADFNYPPLLPFLLAPLAPLGYDAARAVWFALSAACIVAAALRTASALGGDRRAAIAVAATWGAAGAIAVSLREGQVNAVLLLLLVLGCWPLRRPSGAAPAAVGIAIALKLWPAILLWGDLFRRRWRALAGAIGWALAGLALPLALLAAAFEGPLSPAGAGYWRGTPAFLNSGLPAVALRLLDPPAAGERLPRNWLAGNRTTGLELPRAEAAAGVAVFVLALAIGLWLVRRADRAGGRADDAALATALVSLALAVAPIVWPHYQMLQAPGAARLALRFQASRRFAAIAALGAAFLVVNWTEAVVLGPYLEAYGRIATNLPLVWLLSSLPTAGAIALFGLHLSDLTAPAPAAR